MDTIIQKASKGNRTALTQLYEGNKQPAMGLSTDKNTNKMNAHFGNWQ